MPAKTYGSTKRITSLELTEVRTVLSRAKTALGTIYRLARLRTEGNKYALSSKVHTNEELATMRDALQVAIKALEEVELAVGYKEGGQCSP